MKCIGDMKSITHNKGILHVETPEGIVNIHAGLHDMFGRSVTAVTSRADDYAGEPRVRCIPKIGGFRMIRNKRKSRSSRTAKKGAPR